MGIPNVGAAFSAPRAVPWKAPGHLSQVLEAWRHDPKIRKSFALEHTIPATEPVHTSLRDPLPDALQRALAGRRIGDLYAHQARAVELAREGRDFVVATPTASGKSLCYNLPLLESLITDDSARALYLFPTKALARDQEEALRALMHEAELDAAVVTYDGDTPADARRAARERSAVVLTNPDMLHAGILPHHTSWARLFANLKYVVIDELHSYRGVFGSHLANVLRRLLRIARFHGSEPRFMFASATIGNPDEHASRMIGRRVELIDQNGAGSGARTLLVYNPPIVNAELGIRASYVKSAVRLAADLIRARVTTLLFGQSRNVVETMLKYLRDRLTEEHLPEGALVAYRGGYLPKTRRAIELGLRSGEVRCVVATNALELGIDIGALDAVVCAGYPGTIAGSWQRFGRAGRRKEPSLALLVTSSAPLDQYIAQSPEYLVSAPIEQARIDPDNIEILVQHLKCAAFELPFEDGDTFGDLEGESTRDALSYLADHELLHRGSSGNGRTTYHWVSDSYPANNVSLRSASWDNFVIIDLARDVTIAEMDWRSVHTMLHEQAIYQHDGEQYQVERLDFENHKAFIRKVKPDYYTTALTHAAVQVVEKTNSAEPSGHRPHPLRISVGDVRVSEKVVGYKKIKFHTHENVGYGDVHLPEMQMHTTAVWMTFPSALMNARVIPRAVLIDALRGLANALHTVATVGLMIDPHDLGVTVSEGERTSIESVFEPTIYLYDHVAGGIGLAGRLFDEREALLYRARSLVEGCNCGDGCPGCIGPTHALVSASSESPSRRALILALLNDVGIGPMH